MYHNWCASASLHKLTSEVEDAVTTDELSLLSLDCHLCLQVFGHSCAASEQADVYQSSCCHPREERAQEPCSILAKVHGRLERVWSIWRKR